MIKVLNPETLLSLQLFKMLRKIICWITCDQYANTKPANHVAEMYSIYGCFPRGSWRWNSHGCALGIGECGRHWGMCTTVGSPKHPPLQWQGRSPKLLPKSLCVKLSHEAQICSAYFSCMKWPVFCSECVGKKKKCKPQQQIFSSGIRRYRLMFRDQCRTSGIYLESKATF